MITYFHALIRVSTSKFSTFLTQQVQAHRHFDSQTPMPEQRLAQIDTSRSNVLFYDLSNLNDPTHIVHLT
ncbi:LytTR family transcriptional regulator, partial [Pseudoalteromonas sp. S327]